MKKKLVLALICCSLVAAAGCGKEVETAQNETEVATTETNEDVKEEENNAATVDSTDKDNTDLEKEEVEAQPTKEPIPVTTCAVKEKISMPSEAKEYAVIRGKDAEYNVLWEYETEPVYVGQYEGISDPVVREDGVYFVCGGNLYCIDTTSENYGNVKWVNKDDMGAGASMCFDKEGNAYVMSYDTDGYFVVDKDGKTVSHIKELTFEKPQDAQNCFWKNHVTYCDGYLIIYFDSIEDSRIFCAKDGVEGFLDMDFSDLYGEWELVSREVEGDYMTAAELRDEMRMSIVDESDISFYCKDTVSGKVDDYKHMEGVPKLGGMYGGVDEGAFRNWHVECEHDKENSFRIMLTGPDELEVYWYVGPWTEEVYPVVVSMVYKRK